LSPAPGRKERRDWIFTIFHPHPTFTAVADDFLMRRNENFHFLFIRPECRQSSGAFVYENCLLLCHNNSITAIIGHHHHHHHWA
jgi:hypothetical protein